jgi:tetratricopeptide (TPR) repeat protein
MRERDKKRAGGALVAGMLVAAVGIGCQTDQPQTRVVVPSAATSTPEYKGNGEVPEQRYVIRMSNGEQDWEVEFPEVATGYEMHIPLSEQKARTPADSVEWTSKNMTEADKELLRQMRRENPDVEGEGVFVNGQNVNDESSSGSNGQGQQGQGNQSDGQAPQPGLAPADGNNQQSGKSKNGGDDSQQANQGDKKGKNGADPAPYRPSYLLGIEEVRNLYRRGNYEVAMVRLKKLEEAYPGDVKLLTMKGTLWVKLGRDSLARKAWEQVLQIDPENQQVIDALKRLNQSQQ